MDSFVIGDYKYTTNDYYPNEIHVEVNDKTKTSYAALPDTVTYSGKTYRITSGYLCFRGCSNLSTPPKLSANLTSMAYMFAGCSALTTAPTIPSGVTDLNNCFAGCSALTTAPTIPSGVTDLSSCFYNCSALTTAPTIPSGVANLNNCFVNCSALTTAPTIPSEAVYIDSMFAGCSALTTAPTIPSGVEDADRCFDDCVSLTGEIQINASKTTYKSMFRNTTKGIWLAGSSSQLQDIAATATNGNVFVGEIPLDYSLTAERVSADGGVTPDSEGTWLHLTVNIAWSNFAANSIDSMELTINGIRTSATAYADTTKTEAITLPGWRPTAKTEAHLWAQIDTDTQVITFTISDAYHTGAVISLTVPQVFRTFDFLRGGKGIAFGKVAENEGFECAMKSTFEDDFNLKNNSFERNAGGTLNEGIRFVDANDDRIAYMKALSELDSQDRTIEGFNIGTSRDVNGSIKWNTLRLMIDADGEPVVTIGQPAAWRKALGIPLIDNGTADPGSTAANTYKDVSVTFSKTFADVPNVVVGFNSNSTAAAFGRCSCSVASITKTGCVLRFFNGDTVTRHPGIRWIAIGE